MSMETWAKGALRREPDVSDWMGCSYSMASRRAQAICKVAGETGQTVNASHYLAKYAEIMQTLHPAQAEG